MGAALIAVLLALVAVSSEQAAATVTNLASGTSWTCPANVYSVTVECWGGGGAGGSAYKLNNNMSGGGGAGGAYAKMISVPVTPGSNYSYAIGAGGISITNDNVGVPGGDTVFTGDNGITVIAKGGAGGTNANQLSGGGYRTGAPGAGNTNGCIGDVIYAGGSGGSGSNTFGGGGGGGAGDNGTGDNGSTNLPGLGGSGIVTAGGAGGAGYNGPSGNGTNGVAPSGGGGGAKVGQSIQKMGGTGGAGQISLTYFFTVTWTVTNSSEGHAIVIPTNAKPQMDAILTEAKSYLAANTNDTLILFFPANTYYFYDTNSSAMYLNGFTNGNLILRGAGMTATTLVFDQFDQQGIRLDTCNHITIERMHLTRTGLYVTQGDVVSVQPGRVRFQVHPGFPDPVWVFNLGGAATLERTLLGYTHADPLDPHYDPIYAKVLLNDMQSVGSGLYDALLSDTNEVPPWPAGEWVALKCKTGAQTLRFLSCDDCIVQDVRFTRSCGNGLRATDGCNRMLVQRVTIDRSDPINGRAPCFSSPAGGPQIYCGYAGATIKDCIIIGTADDGIGYFPNIKPSEMPTNGVLPTNGVITGNIVRDNQARGIIIDSSAGGVCANNTLVRNNDASLLLICSGNSSENNTNAAVLDWTIYNNAFIEAWMDPVIWLTSQCTNAGLHDNIDIVSNSFIEAPRNNNIIYVNNANEIRINHNTITSFSPISDYPAPNGVNYKPSSATNTLVYVYEGAWVHGTNNFYLQSLYPTNRFVSQQSVSTDVVSVAWSYLATPKPKLVVAGATQAGANAQQVTVQITNLQPGNICRFWKSTNLVAWQDQGVIVATNLQGAGAWTEITTNQPAAFYRTSW